jgi:hypothetical protein
MADVDKQRADIEARIKIAPTDAARAAAQNDALHLERTIDKRKQVIDTLRTRLGDDPLT